MRTLNPYDFSLNVDLLIEMLLFVLIENFVFSVEEGTEITWTFQVLQQPGIIGPDGKVDPKSQLPLKISFVGGEQR